MRAKEMFAGIMLIALFSSSAVLSEPSHENRIERFEVATSRGDCEENRYFLTHVTPGSELISWSRTILDFIHTPVSLGYFEYEAHSKTGASVDDVRSVLKSKGFQETARSQLVAAIERLVRAREKIAKNKKSILGSRDINKSQEIEEYRAARDHVIKCLEKRFGLVHVYNYGCD